jgi:DNA-binding MarR family transcriptional regulator
MKSDPFGAWFMSSRLKTALFHTLNLKNFPDGHTVSGISRLLNTDRSTISRLLTDCHKNGFIYRNKAPNKERYYLPSTELLENGKRYAEYYTDQILSMENELDRRLFFDVKRLEKRNND